MLISATAPIRICDCGGWTDTWFARRGRVFNIAVWPRAEVQLRTSPRQPGQPPVVIHAADFGHRYAPEMAEGRWDRHPLLEAALAHMPLPSSLAAEVTITCDVPPGASTGTSAAVTVALLGALDRARGGTLTRLEIAAAAHAVETERLGQQSGVQDQICSALGGLNDIRITAYPHADVRQIELPPDIRWELERRLVLVFLGRSHSSSEVHGRVIARLEAEQGESAELDALVAAARDAAAAVVAGELTELGLAMQRNTEAQRSLHPDLVCPDADAIIAVARSHGASGWKVNGAGGDGGSLTLLGPADTAARRAMLCDIAATSPRFRTIPIVLDAEGLRVWVTEE
jgi:D-glycero-alpha-D-manno-heptose-7-phosphate kinase